MHSSLYSYRSCSLCVYSYLVIAKQKTIPCYRQRCPFHSLYVLYRCMGGGKLRSCYMSEVCRQQGDTMNEGRSSKHFGSQSPLMARLLPRNRFLSISFPIPFSYKLCTETCQEGFAPFIKYFFCGRCPHRFCLERLEENPKSIPPIFERSWHGPALDTSPRTA